MQHLLFYIRKSFFGFEKDFENKYLHFIFRFYFFISKKIWTFSRFLLQVVIKACSAQPKGNRTDASRCIYVRYVCFLCHFQPSGAL